jgi:hypothetical protein
MTYQNNDNGVIKKAHDEAAGNKLDAYENGWHSKATS